MFKDFTSLLRGEEKKTSCVNKMRDCRWRFAPVDNTTRVTTIPRRRSTGSHVEVTGAIAPRRSCSGAVSRSFPTLAARGVNKFTRITTNRRPARNENPTPRPCPATQRNTSTQCPLPRSSGCRKSSSCGGGCSTGSRPGLRRMQTPYLPRKRLVFRSRTRPSLSRRPPEIFHDFSPSLIFMARIDSRPQRRHHFSSETSRLCFLSPPRPWIVLKSCGRRRREGGDGGSDRGRFVLLIQNHDPGFASEGWPAGSWFIVFM